MRDTTGQRSFSDEQRLLLTSVLDRIIPACPERGLPAAGQVGVANHIESALRGLPDLWQLIEHGLVDLDSTAQSRHGCRFEGLDAADQQALLQEQTFVFPLSFHTYVGYYQDPRVTAALGLASHAPHPQGYGTIANDLTLLDIVRQRPPLFRG